MNKYGTTALVINCGSSSVKFAILDPKDGHTYLSGIAEALGLDEARISWRFEGQEKEKASLSAGAGHERALEFLVKNVMFRMKSYTILSFLAAGTVSFKAATFIASLP